MPAPHLFADSGDLARIKINLASFPWYQKAFENLKSGCDEMLRRGFFVPDTCGYVFYNTCKSDNTPLVFDPYDPENHVCPKCGMNYREKAFHRAWQCYYHQWLSQMSINLGISYAVTGDESYGKAVQRMLLDYLRFYKGYENNDNELGSTKVFQSTYIESVWLTYLCCAYDLTNSASFWTKAQRDDVTKHLFLESADVIRDYDEKRNNRQAFNNAALCAAALAADDGELLNYALRGPHGFTSHMEGSVLSDGLWYEGDNYHFATVPSLVNIAEMCLHNNIDLYSGEFRGHSIRGMFEAPLKSLQPDLTFPSRKDSPYGSSIAQRWYAGLYELAHTRYPSGPFGRALKVMYGENPDGREYKNAAGLMDVFAPTPASRSLLDWRGFLTLTPDLGISDGLPFQNSINMEGTGLAVLRKADCYASLDYGDYGGGHGHPDRLSLTFFSGKRRLLSDYGTGQYYFDHLNWYRSTIGHNTLNADGLTQLPKSGKWDFFGETNASAAARGSVVGLWSGVDARRTILLLGDGLLFDCLEARSEEVHRYHDALHGFGPLELEGDFRPAALQGDQYRFLRDAKGFSIEKSFVAAFHTEEGSLRILSASPPEGEASVYQANAYGPPSELPKVFPILITEQNGKNACFARILEDCPNGREGKARSFEREQDGSYLLTLEGELSVRIWCTEEGLRVCRYDKMSLIGFETYGQPEIPGVVKLSVPPSPSLRAAGKLQEEGFLLELPDLYGSCSLSEEVIGEKDCVRMQNDRRAARAKTNMLFRGVLNEIPFAFLNFTPNRLDETLTADAFPPQLGVTEEVILRLEPGEWGEFKIPAIPTASDGPLSFLFPLTGEEWQFTLSDPVELTEWVELSAEDEEPLKVSLRNRTKMPLACSLSFREAPVTLNPEERRVFSLPLEQFHGKTSYEREVLSAPPVLLEEGSLTFSYCLEAPFQQTKRHYSRAFVKPLWKNREIPLDRAPFTPNLLLCSKDQVSRGEKHWEGPADLSAQGMLSVSDGESLTLLLHVKDDRVLFSGGKFPFDNDGVQIYFDRRPGRLLEEGVGQELLFGLLLCPGVFDEASRAVPLTKTILKPEEISLSAYEEAGGYALLLDLPFACLGGVPRRGEAWGFDLIVNDRDRGVRRDQQMIWSGALLNERIYLREDHHTPSRYGLLLF